jgi:hypothetical protein
LAITPARGTLDRMRGLTTPRGDPPNRPPKSEGFPMRTTGPITALFVSACAAWAGPPPATGPIVWRAGRLVFVNNISMSAFAGDDLEAVRVLDWGDIAPDTLVGGVTFRTCAFYPEGPVPGLEAEITLFDADDGDPETPRVYLTELVTTLSGGGDEFPFCFSARDYSVAFDTPIELGDTDGVAAIENAVFNPFSFADLDGDARHDFSYRFAFNYPEDPSDPRSQGVLLIGVPAAGPSGGDRQTAIYRGETFLYNTDIFRNVYLLLHGPGCNAADHAPPFGVLDMNDVSAFVDAFLDRRPPADQAVPYFKYDLADLVAFAEAITAGCP